MPGSGLQLSSWWGCPRCGPQGGRGEVRETLHSGWAVVSVEGNALVAGGRPPGSGLISSVCRRVAGPACSSCENSMPQPSRDGHRAPCIFTADGPQHTRSRHLAFSSRNGDSVQGRDVPRPCWALKTRAQSAQSRAIGAMQTPSAAFRGCIDFRRFICLGLHVR